MTLSAPQYILDSKGAKTSVIISLKDYEKILEMIEDLEDVELYNDAKNENDEYLNINDAFAIIDAKRAKNDLRSTN